MTKECQISKSKLTHRRDDLSLVIGYSFVIMVLSFVIPCCLHET